MFNYYLLPEPYRTQAQRYVEEGVIPGDAMLAALCGDWAGTRTYLEEEAGEGWEHLTTQIHLWRREEAPSRCHGCLTAVTNWIANKGMVRSFRLQVERSKMYPREITTSGTGRLRN